MSDAEPVQGDAAAFARDTEPFRRELLAHCYRVLGSLDEAEDLVQETYLRAWRSYAGFEGRSSIRTWLYRIATNACLNALEKHRRRPLPSGLGGPSSEPGRPLELAGSDVHWLQPAPDHLIAPDSRDPAVIVAFRESVRLALIASLQYLAPRQRIVLILRDVLDWPAGDVAQILGISTPAVKSLLQRARARLEEMSPHEDQVLEEPSEEKSRALLDQYVFAFENADSAALEGALRADAQIQVTPFRTWFAGRVTCTAYITGQVFTVPGEYSLVPTRANGQLAVLSYRRGPDGVFRAYGVAVVTTPTGGISALNVFGDARLVRLFGHPLELPQPLGQIVAPPSSTTSAPTM